MNQLRDALQSFAEDAPSGVDLLERVRRRSRERNRHRYAVLAAATVVLTAGAAGVAGWSPEPSGPPPGAVGVTSPWSLVDAPAFTLPAFPYTPGWAPAGAGPAQPGFSTGGRWLNYPEDGTWPVHVLVTGPGPGLPGEPLGPVALTGGRTAQRYEIKPGQEALAWPAGEHTVAVVGFSGAKWSDLVRFANELRADPMTIRAPFRIERIPDGTELVLVDANSMEFTTTWLAPSLTVSVRLVPAGPRATTRTGDKQTTYISVDQNRMIEIVSTGSPGLSEEDLLAFAAGVHLNDGAR
jgi:hypothetical protein